MEKHQRVLAYLILSVFLIADAWLFILSQGNSYFQTILVAAAVAFYVLWGTWVHMLEERLNHKLIAEYVLLGALIILLFYVQASL